MKPILIISILFLYSCESQSNFDLTNIKLNKNKISEIIPKNIDSKTFDSGLSGGVKNKKLTKELGTEIKMYLTSKPIIGIKLAIDLLDATATALSVSLTGNTMLLILQ